jgi:hypothetical protein
LPLTIPPGGSVMLDWSRKRTGRVTLAGRGVLAYAYGASPELIALAAGEMGLPKDDGAPTWICGKPSGTISLAADGAPLHGPIAALRWLRLTNASDQPVLLAEAGLMPSEAAGAPLGSFACSDPALTRAWRMGVDTVHLCTQPGTESMFPVFAPFGSGHVQWDGCRRDREIWGGDLRPGSLAWLYNFADHDPIANSLYLIMSGQHDGCSEHGLFPGSGSTHQTFYEWAFWEVVCLWEYHLHTGDRRLLPFAAHALPKFLAWCERRLEEGPDGWIHGGGSWMYTLSFERQALPSLQAVAAIALPALASLFDVLGDGARAARARVLRARLAERFHAAFFEPGLDAYRFLTRDPGGAPRSDLCTNAWAILADLAPTELRPRILASLARHRTPSGSLNFAPAIPGLGVSHNVWVWPYANAYEMVARLHAGDAAGAFDLLRRYTAPIAARDQHTLFEAIAPDGGLPLAGKPFGTLSLCHAWAGQGSWALQRYLLGVAPTAPGWTSFAVAPLPSELAWVRGSVVTPRGLIEVELEAAGARRRGVVRYPTGLQPIGAIEGISLEPTART